MPVSLFRKGRSLPRCACAALFLPCVKRDRQEGPLSPGNVFINSLSLFVMAAVSGSRSLPVRFSALVGSVARALAARFPLCVGCASGADLFARSAVPSARVFSVGSFRSPGVPFGAALARRSAACVRAGVAAGGPVAGFVSGPCPSAVRPSASSSACFCGSGSGSWASLSFAAGLGAPVVVWWCGPGAPSLPAWGGSWVPVSGAVAGVRLPAGGWLFVPGAPSLSLF